MNWKMFVENWAELTETVAKSADLEIPICDLEYIGLSVRVINALEAYYDCLFLHQLIELTPHQLFRMKNFDTKGMNNLYETLLKLPEIEKEKKRWNMASEKVQFYKDTINYRELLS